MSQFKVLNENNGQGGSWIQGGGGADDTKDVQGEVDFSGNDKILGMAGDDVIVDGGGSDTVFGGRGSDRIVEKVGGNLIFGDTSHPNMMDEDAAEGTWAAHGDESDMDMLQYWGNPEGIFVGGINYWSSLGKSLRDSGFDHSNKGDGAAYAIMNKSERLNYWELQEGQEDGQRGRHDGEPEDLLESVLDKGVDIAVGIDHITGTQFADHFMLRNHDDRVSAGDGNDVIHTRGGDDFILGGAGNDRIWTGDDMDTIRFVATDDRDGHDIVRDFDVKTRDSENDWDTLNVEFEFDNEAGKKSWIIDSAQDLAELIVYLEKDGDHHGDTDAIQKGNDLILDFDGSSITLKNVIDDLSKDGGVDLVELDGKTHAWDDVIDLA